MSSWSAGFRISAHDSEHFEAERGPDVAGVGVLGPLMFWATSPMLDAEAWRRGAPLTCGRVRADAEQGLWRRVGAGMVTSALEEATEVSWSASDSSWASRRGSKHAADVMVTAERLALGYRELARAMLVDDVAAMQMWAWMLDAPDDVAFGARQVAADHLAVSPERVAVASGWGANADGDVLRTHVVTLTLTDEEDVVGSVVVSTISLDAAASQAYGLQDRHQDRIPMHWLRAGSMIQTGTGRALGRMIRSGL